MSAEATNTPPIECSYDKLVNGTNKDKEAQWNQNEFTTCYKAIVGEGKKIKSLEEENKKLKEDSYSGTSVATGSIGAGAGGLVCGLGLFPCLVKLVSKFR